MQEMFDRYALLHKYLNLYEWLSEDIENDDIISDDDVWLSVDEMVEFHFIPYVGNA